MPWLCLFLKIESRVFQLNIWIDRHRVNCRHQRMYTAPDPKQQAKLIVKSIQQSGIDPETIGYIESAANGSALGDPIEVRKYDPDL